MNPLILAMTALVLTGGADSGGLSITLSAPAAVKAGQAVELSLQQTVNRDLTMDAVEDNDLSTEIRVEPIGGGAAQTLTGSDRWRHLHPGQRPHYSPPLHVKAGESWTSVLDLNEYAAPLPAGRYRIVVIHHYPGLGGQVARSNPVEVVVKP